MTPMSHLVTCRGPCAEQEKQDLLAYLRANSHVRLPIQLLEAGRLRDKLQGMPGGIEGTWG